MVNLCLHAVNANSEIHKHIIPQKCRTCRFWFVSCVWAGQFKHCFKNVKNMSVQKREPNSPPNPSGGRSWSLGQRGWEGQEGREPLVHVHFHHHSRRYLFEFFSNLIVRWTHTIKFYNNRLPVWRTTQSPSSLVTSCSILFKQVINQQVGQ